MRLYDESTKTVVELFGEDAFEHCLNCSDVTQHESGETFCTFGMDQYISIDERAEDFECPWVKAIFGAGK